MSEERTPIYARDIMGARAFGVLWAICKILTFIMQAMLGDWSFEFEWSIGHPGAHAKQLVGYLSLRYEKKV